MDARCPVKTEPTNKVDCGKTFTQPELSCVRTMRSAQLKAGQRVRAQNKAANKTKQIVAVKAVSLT